MEYLDITQMFHYTNFCDTTVFFVLFYEHKTNFNIITQKALDDKLVSHADPQITVT